MHLISSLEVGGSERLLIDLVKSCTETPQIPQVVVVMNDHVNPRMATELNATSVPTYFLNRPEGSRNPKYILDLKEIIQKHRVSVIHSHNPGSKYWSVLCRVLKFDLKLVHTFHHRLSDMNGRDAAFNNSMIDVSIAISRSVAKQASALRIRRVEQIDNGIPLSLFRSVSPQPLGSRARIISVGRLCPEIKGQDVLIRAIKRCVDRGLDVECTLVGNPPPGDSQTLPKLEALTSSLQLSDRVHFLQGRTDVATLLADANMFVLPSRLEAFGLALVEAMAAGLPVIASNIDGPADILTDEVDGLFFEPGSDEQLADKIETLIQSPALTEKLRNNGIKRSSEFDISTMRDKYMAVYRRLITS